MRRALGFLIPLLFLTRMISPPGLLGQGGRSLSGLDVEPVDPLETVTVTVRTGERIDKLLRQMGIHPDGEALSVVYSLNPDLESLSPLAAGSRIVLPAAKERGVSEGAASEGLRLSVAAQTKKALLTASQTLGPVVEKVSFLPAARFTGPENKEEVVGALDEVRGYLDELNRRLDEGSRPFSPEMLRQSLAEARLVQSLLEGFVKSGKALADADRETVIAVSEDMNLKARNFDAARPQGEPHRRWRDARVVVRLQGEGLRVYYVPRLLARSKDAVRQLPVSGSEAGGRLPEGDYLVWAGREGNPAPLTRQVPVQVRKQEGGKEILVDL
ncbi:MAG TPA: hypothetical protein VF756_17905 [Thermoanaerobaculia bacterium]